MNFGVVLVGEEVKLQVGDVVESKELGCACSMLGFGRCSGHGFWSGNPDFWSGNPDFWAGNPDF